MNILHKTLIVALLASSAAQLQTFPFQSFLGRNFAKKFMFKPRLAVFGFLGGSSAKEMEKLKEDSNEPKETTSGNPVEIHATLNDYRNIGNVPSFNYPKCVCPKNDETCEHTLRVLQEFHKCAQKLIKNNKEVNHVSPILNDAVNHTGLFACYTSALAKVSLHAHKKNFKSGSNNSTQK
jgi:hypothetical protein